MSVSLCSNKCGQALGGFLLILAAVQQDRERPATAPSAHRPPNSLPMLALTRPDTDHGPRLALMTRAVLQIPQHSSHSVALHLLQDTNTQDLEITSKGCLIRNTGRSRDASSCLCNPANVYLSLDPVTMFQHFNWRRTLNSKGRWQHSWHNNCTAVVQTQRLQCVLTPMKRRQKCVDTNLWVHTSPPAWAHGDSARARAPRPEGSRLPIVRKQNPWILRLLLISEYWMHEVGTRLFPQ